MPTPEEIAGQLIAHKAGELTSLMTHLGLRLGLFETLRDGEATSVDDLAARAGLHHRWVLEWARQQSSAGVLGYVDEERFQLAPETAEMLLDPDSTQYMGWLFYEPTGGHEGVEALIRSFQTGLGITWDQQGDRGTTLVQTSTSAQHRLLPTEVVPLLDGVKEKLESGAEVIDVGCGCGEAIVAHAKAFPNSNFVGIDPSPTALDRARALAKDEGVQNLQLNVEVGEGVDVTGHYDFAMVLDCMHDMTHPRDVASTVRRALKDDGTWLVKDIRSADTLRENMENPAMAAAMYGVSVCFCMSSSMSTPDGEGLGTMGYSANVAREIAEGAGFTRFSALEYDGDPFNVFFEIRP